MSLRLSDVPHPALEKANGSSLSHLKKLINAGLPLPKEHAFSLGQRSGRQKRTDGRWVKLRLGGEGGGGRGLLRLAEGQFWLAWVGNRRDGYKSFNERRARDGSTAYFEPGADDFDRYNLEEAYAEEQQRLIGRRNWLLRGVLNSWANQDSLKGEGPSGESVVIEAFDDNGLVTVEMTFEAYDVADFALLVDDALHCLPGVSPEEWDAQLVEPGPPFSLYTILDANALTALSEAASTHGHETIISSPGLLGAGTPDGFRHIVSRTDQMSGYYGGEVIRGVCGRRFVPTQDFEHLPTCPNCEALRPLAEEVASRVKGGRE